MTLNETKRLYRKVVDPATAIHGRGGWEFMRRILMAVIDAADDLEAAQAIRWWQNVGDIDEPRSINHLACAHRIRREWAKMQKKGKCDVV